MDEMKAWFRAREKVARAASEACVQEAGGLEEVFVRLDLAAKGGPPRRVLVLDPEASPALKQCIERACKQHALPRAPSWMRRRDTVRVHF